MRHKSIRENSDTREPLDTSDPAGNVELGMSFEVITAGPITFPLSSPTASHQTGSDLYSLTNTAFLPIRSVLLFVMRFRTKVDDAGSEADDDVGDAAAVG